MSSQTYRRMTRLAKQLEAEMAIAIAEAKDDLAAADLFGLLDGIWETLISLPEAEQLRLAGWLLLELAELCELRAVYLCQSWEAGGQRRCEDGIAVDQEPILPQDLFDGLIQKTSQLDLSDFLKSGQPRPKSPQSLVGTVAKDAVLQMLDELEAEETIGIAHQEDITAWTTKITAWLNQQPHPVSLADLDRAMGLDLVEIWIAILLAGTYRFEQRGEFYNAPDQIFLTLDSGLP